jgi:hypothetical protein
MKLLTKRYASHASFNVPRVITLDNANRVSVDTSSYLISWNVCWPVLLTDISKLEIHVYHAYRIVKVAKGIHSLTVIFAGQATSTAVNLASA